MSASFGLLGGGCWGVVVGFLVGWCDYAAQTFRLQRYIGINVPNFSERLRTERERLELSQQGLAEKCGVTARSQRNYESGERNPDSVYLAAIAAAGADVLYILTGQRSGAAAAAPVAAEPAAQLSRRALAVAQNYEATSEEGKKIIEAAAFAAAKPAAKRGAKAA